METLLRRNNSLGKGSEYSNNQAIPQHGTKLYYRVRPSYFRGTANATDNEKPSQMLTLHRNPRYRL